MIKEDDRTEEQKLTHTFAVVARDSFLSGWGLAKNGASRCAWSYSNSLPSNKRLKLEQWVKGRGDMKYVNTVNLDNYKPPRGTAHFHIYVVGDNHPGLS